MAQEPKADNREILFNKQVSILNGQIADHKRAVDALSSQDFTRVQDYFKAILKDYDTLLHNVNANAEIRDRAAFVLDIGSKFVNAKQFFEKKIKDCQAKLDQLDMEKSRKPKNLSEKLFTFVR